MMYRVLLSLTLACLTSSLVGCSGAPYRPISGNVTYDGQPLKKGVITLYPKGEGTTVGGEIVDGSFSLSREQGPSPGKYRVEIVAFRPTGKTELDIDTQEQVDIEEQYLPRRYNRDSQLEIEVTAEGENQFPFDLKP